jgi:hypothetical protein
LAPCKSRGSAQSPLTIGMNFMLLESILGQRYHSSQTEKDVLNTLCSLMRWPELTPDRRCGSHGSGRSGYSKESWYLIGSWSWIREGRLRSLDPSGRAVEEIMIARIIRRISATVASDTPQMAGQIRLGEDKRLGVGVSYDGMRYCFCLLFCFQRPVETRRGSAGASERRIAMQSNQQYTLHCSLLLSLQVGAGLAPRYEQSRSP